MTTPASLPVSQPASNGIHNCLVALADCLVDAAAAVETWRRRHKASMQGARVESRILRDLGISEAQRFIEVNKPFWEK